MIARFIILLLLWICFTGSSPKAYAQKITDPAFQKYLQKYYPQVLTYNRDEIIPTEAAKVIGCLDASGYGISNANGIQSFTSLTKIDLHNNNLSSFPDISACTGLQSLNLAQNKLEQLPSLSTLTSLTELIVYGNKLKALPNLDNNTALQQLIANNNQITALPSLSNLTALTDLVLSNNLLTQLPDLSYCKLLVKLICGANAITVPPNLQGLQALEILDFCFNKLSQMPDISSNTSLEQAYFNDNKISYIYSFPILPSLQKVKLYDNELTFSSLTKILPIPNHKNIFEIIPQADTFVTQILSSTRMDTVHIKTGIDAYASNVYYRWYKNGVFYKNCTYDYFSINNLSLSDSGVYNCVIQHDSFPGIAFRSDLYTIKVKNCVNTEALALTISSADCETSGRLAVRSEDYQKLKYVLGRGAYASQADTSTTGEFKSLPEGSYSLKMVTEKGCVVDYPNGIVIPKEECNYPLLTPNGDGDRDTYYFEEPGEVMIYDKKGNLMKTIATPGYWDATYKNGKVSAGLYVADLNKGEKIVRISVVY